AHADVPSDTADPHRTVAGRVAAEPVDAKRRLAVSPLGARCPVRLAGCRTIRPVAAIAASRRLATGLGQHEATRKRATPATGGGHTHVRIADAAGLTVALGFG